MIVGESDRTRAIPDRLRAVAGGLRASLLRHKRGWKEALAAGGIALALLTVAGSIVVAQQFNGPNRVIPAAAMVSHAEYLKIAEGLSPYARDAALRLGEGRQGWTPTGIEGWGIYDTSEAPRLVSRQLSFEEAREFNALIRPAIFPIRPMKKFSVREGTEDFTRALECLTQAVYYEAGFESGEGQRAVAQVVLNRVQHPAYPNTVCGVVYQGSQRVTGCQFSFTCDGSLSREPNAAAWDRARTVARDALRGHVYEAVGSATHYHADYVLPYWAVTLVKLRQIGAHIFYRMTGPTGAPEAYNARYAGGEAVIDPTVLYGGDARTPDAPTVFEVTPVEEAVAEQPRLVTLMTGGEARTYLVGSPAALAAAPMAGTARSALPPEAALDLGAGSAAASGVSVGALSPARRAPSADEIRQVNERLRQLQMQQTAAPLTPGAPPGT